VSTGARRFRFRPKHRAIAGVTLGVGGATAIAGGVIAAIGPVVVGAIGVVIGALYVLSPVWKLVVVVDDAGVAVVGAGEQVRFRLAWGDVVSVIASPSTRTCFVDGGAPERSLLVPGEGAPAPYAIEDGPALYERIVASVAPEKVREVERIVPPRRRRAPEP
jgi:hypothetical protein